MVQNTSNFILVTARELHVRSSDHLTHIILYTYNPWINHFFTTLGILAHIAIWGDLSKHDHRHWSGHPHIILRVLVKNQSGFLTQLTNFTLACIISYWGHFSKIFFLLVTTPGLSFRLKNYFYEYLLVQLCVAI